MIGGIIEDMYQIKGTEIIRFLVRGTDGESGSYTTVRGIDKNNVNPKVGDSIWWHHPKIMVREDDLVLEKYANSSGDKQTFYECKNSNQ